MDRKELLSWGKTIVITFILVCVIRVFFFAPYVVEGESMMPTVKDDEKLIVSKIGYYFNEPQRGDIVVFHASQDNDFIKRIIGVEGDTIEIKQDILYVNGELIEEPYLDEYKEKYHKDGMYFNEDFEKETVPKGHLFVMGDNRANSHDSRFVGPIEIERIVGRASIVFYPFKDFRTMDEK